MLTSHLLYCYDTNYNGAYCSIMHFKQCAVSFETKGGPIQSLVVHDVTKLSSCDIVIGDSRGFVTVFCNEQILARKVVTDRCICCLLLDSDASKFFIIIKVILIIMKISVTVQHFNSILLHSSFPSNDDE